MNARQWLVAVGALVGGLVVGAVVGDLVASDTETTVVDLSFAEPVPLVQPIAEGDRSPGDDQFIPIRFDGETSSIAVEVDPEDDDPDGGGDGATTDEPDIVAGGGGAAADLAEAPAAQPDDGFLLDHVEDLGRQIRLIDICADGNDVDCPLGVAADVGPVFNDTPPLEILVSVRNEGERERCDIGWPEQPFDLPLLIMTTNPATIELTYSTPPDDFGETRSETITIEAPGEGDPERTRWESILERGDSMLDEVPIDWVQRCINAERLYETRQVYRVEAVATDAFGNVAVFERAYRAPAVIDRKLPVISIRSDNRIRVGVFTGLEELAWVYPVESSAVDAQSCSDIEAEHVAGNQWPLADENHPDPMIGRLIGNLDAVVNTANFEKRYDWVFDLREGSRYRLCIFYLTQGEQSFDTLEVVDRLEYHAFTPNRHQVRISVEYIDVETVQAGGVELRPFTYPTEGACYGTSPRERVTVQQPGRYTLPTADLCVSDGAFVQREMLIAMGFRPIGGEFGDFRDAGYIPIDVGAGCDRTSDGPGCLGSRVEWFDVPFGGDVGATGTIRIRLDYLRSNSQGAGNWNIGVEGLFEDSGFVPPQGGPRLDENGLEIGPVQGRVDALGVAFVTNRPTTASVTIVGPTCEDGGGTHTSPAPTDTHEFVLEGLCADTHYSMTIDLEDEQGETMSYPNGYLHQTFTKTNAWESTLLVRLRAVGIDPAAASAWCADRQAGLPEWTIPSDCYRFIEGPPSARVHGPTGDLYPVGFHCLWENPAGLEFTHTPGTWYRHGEEILITVEADLSLGERCGAERDFYFAEVDRTFSTTTSALADGPASGFFTLNGIQWEVFILASGTHVANG